MLVEKIEAEQKHSATILAKISGVFRKKEKQKE